MRSAGCRNELSLGAVSPGGSPGGAAVAPLSMLPSPPKVPEPQSVMLHHTRVGVPSL